LLRKKPRIPTPKSRRNTASSQTGAVRLRISKNKKINLIPAQNNCTKTQYILNQHSRARRTPMASQAMKITLERIALFQFTPAHCAQARAMLGWSVEELSQESRVSVDAIQRFEAEREVLDVTRLTLAYRFESEGLVFFPGFAPGRGMNLRGSTPNPVGRADFAMVE
jgi:hypothetical protein